ncbi:alpha/beta hydrolase family protein [Saccharopolyspora erythraea NRRL 2338]|uniref:Proteinase (Secreted protein) n=2 Tax=Saccharopolyspora erythraea TaxID=1836 RepID=A4FLL8_SACEN|nr:alpha/beta hydrolase [Saccharopolyspora erythraea]EQD82991.1 proteinase [Saccharopolyspora erythraea D]PFG98582.1 alpha/beta hydrolase family protein [Saccharopolyspora erythraea NRRL 2338]QRK88620.1 alpha/beta fold hydrolase [Saccharopolyspora erythraea]CAM04943.1 proteinase (secreted protein) [Saccharopolyspora erythraea NRRL 2338]
MRKRRTPALGALLALAAVTASAAPALAAPAAGAPAPQTAVDWQPCEQNPQVQCATMRVPVDWSQPDGASITIPLARQPAADPAARIGTLVHMPGGPGGSGVAEIVGGSRFSPEVAARFDIVSFDPRGVGLPDQVKCDAGLVEQPPPLVSDDPRHFEVVRDYNKRLGESCRELTGPLLDHVDTVSVARDIDALRAALGEERISLYGISYGTQTGQAYAENFPTRVRALLLDSVFDHNLSPREFLTTQAATAEDSFAEFVRWCESEERCALHGQDVGAFFDGLYARAERGELTDPQDPSKPLTPERLTQLTVSALYEPMWEQLAERLRSFSEQTGPVAVAEPRTLPSALPMVCSDQQFRVGSAEEYAELWKAQRENAPHVRFGVGAAALHCVDFPVRSGNPPHDPDLGSAPPVLIMNALHDPATGYNWAKNVNAQIEQSTLLTYDGWGHGVYSRSECTTRAADRYLIDLRMPPEGAHCPAVPPKPLPQAATVGPW